MNDLKLSKSEGWYVAEVPSLHVVTRARTLAGLRKNLKEAVEVAVDGLLELKKMQINVKA